MAAACVAGTYKFTTQGAFTVAVPDTSVAECVSCGGTGLLSHSVQEGPRSYDVSAPCAKKKLEDRLKVFNSANIPGILAQASFDSFRPAHPEQARAQQLAKEFAHRWPQGRGFTLSGPVGTGKTHLLAAALKHTMIEMGAKAAYVEISLLYANIRRGFQQGKSGGEIIEPLSRVDLLAIDELGKGRGSAFELETLDELIARRYNANKLTLFATNYSLKSPEDRGKTSGYLTSADNRELVKDSPYLCDRVGDRIFSRLCEMTDFVEFPNGTPDFRRMRLSNDYGRKK